MKTRIVVASAVLVAVAGWVGACTPQPPLPCPIQTSNPYFGLPPYAVFYKLKAGTGACALKEYEQLGFQKYRKSFSDPTRVAVRPGDLGTHWENGRLDPADPEGKLVNAIGFLPSVPDQDDRCGVTFTEPGANHAQQSFEAIPDEALADGGVVPGEPALAIKYEWTALSFIATAAVPGSAFTGELSYTQDGCTATYAAEGFWPEVHCDRAANALADGGMDLPDGGMLEDLDCASQADVASGHSLGSGINPDFPVVCDGTLGVCVLGTRNPSDRSITRKSVADLTKL